MLNILWDASHLWGYLLLHAARSAGIPHRLIKGSEIAQAGLSGKVLAVPGGSARSKAAALGPAGQGGVRRFVASGGHYLGICGGAGLALGDGLGLCPWYRAGMPDRLQHLVSGYVRCVVESEGHPLVPAGMKEALLPVWWPGRFDEPAGGSGDVEVLARYHAPGPDLHVADLPYGILPPDVLVEWNIMYGVTMRPSLLDQQPCVVTGNYGRGDWVLSYCHLETPSGALETSGIFPGASSDGLIVSPSDANRWLFHILQAWTGFPLSETAIPENWVDVAGHHADPIGKHVAAVPSWDPAAQVPLWDDPVLLSACAALDELTKLALSLGLLFPRTSWLMGWRSGMPGAQFNSLRLALFSALVLEPTDRRVTAWKGRRQEFSERFRLFRQGARSWLLARRLADTLSDALASTRPDVLPKALLTDQRETLFGSAMSSGGLCGQLLEDLESLLFE